MRKNFTGDESYDALGGDVTWQNGEGTVSVDADGAVIITPPAEPAQNPRIPGSQGEEWEVREHMIGANSKGVYFPLNVFSRAVQRTIVTVKWYPGLDRFTCLTHLQADACAHTRFVRRWVAEHPQLALPATIATPQESLTLCASNA